MTDIVEQLTHAEQGARNQCQCRSDAPVCAACLCGQAADEIKRLRTELAVATEWRTMKSAPHEVKEIIGSVWYLDEKSGKMVCKKETFISFWSPSLNKFYGSPTHWMPLPAPPKEPTP